jgi:hypothetical protein
MNWPIWMLLKYYLAYSKYSLYLCICVCVWYLFKIVALIIEFKKFLMEWGSGEIITIVDFLGVCMFIMILITLIDNYFIILHVKVLLYSLMWRQIVLLQSIILEMNITRSIFLLKGRAVYIDFRKRNILVLSPGRLLFDLKILVRYNKKYTYLSG